MKIHIPAALAAACFAAAASADSTGAGPAGTGSSLVGSVVSSEAQSKAENNTSVPGMVGIVMLAAEQNAALASYLSSQPGTTASGSLITSPTTFADGTAGRITLDTATGALTLTRL